MVAISRQKAHQNAAFLWYTPQARSPFWLLKPASEHALLLLRLYEFGLCCYLVIHRKTITPITAVSLPFVTYLLTLPRSTLSAAETFIIKMMN
jgi:hypothetical protein